MLNPANRRGTDPYARWCGRGGIARCPPIPIDGGAAAAAQSAMLLTAVTFPLGAVALLTPQLQSRISTSLTDVTTSSTISMSSSSASIPLRPRGRADMDLTGRCAIIANEEDRYDHSGEGVA